VRAGAGMLIRLTALVVLLALFLAACSLAEDITPPPGYLSPTAPLAGTLATTAATIQPATPTATPSAAGTSALGTPLSQSGVVTGSVVGSAGSAQLSGLTVTLLGFEQSTSGGTPTQVLSLSAPLAADGLFRFEAVDMPPGRIFVSEVVYEGVPYQSTTVTAAQGQTSLELPSLTVYPTTQNLNLLQVKQVHVLLDFSTSQAIQVVELYVIANPGQQTVLVQTDGSSLPFVKLPAGATNASFQPYAGGATFLGTANGFAMPPVASGQLYGMEVSFTLPSSAPRFNLSLPFVLPAGSVTVFVPGSVRVSGSGLSDQGIQNVQGILYHQYDSSSQAAGAVLELAVDASRLSASSGSTPSTGPVIALGAFGLLLIAAGVFFFLRDRARQRGLQVGGTETPPARTGPDEIADAIVALDDQFQAGRIARAVYEQRRSELKDQLRKRLG